MKGIGFVVGGALLVALIPGCNPPPPADEKAGETTITSAPASTLGSSKDSSAGSGVPSPENKPVPSEAAQKAAAARDAGMTGGTTTTGAPTDPGSAQSGGGGAEIGTTEWSSGAGPGGTAGAHGPNHHDMSQRIITSPPGISPLNEPGSELRAKPAPMTEKSKAVKAKKQGNDRIPIPDPSPPLQDRR